VICSGVFSQKWAQYRIEAPPPAATRRASELDEVIADSRRRIAAVAGRPESAITITITY
jgi:hypothetical protein